MRITRNLGFLLLAIWLILTGLLTIIPTLAVSGIGVILALLAIAAGVLILIER
jgi:hypothetical protein